MIVVIPLVIIGLGISLLFIPKNIASKVIYYLSLYLFIYKLVEYTYHAINLNVIKTPIEFSTISYFVLSITVVFKLDRFKGVAAFTGFISGIGYLISYMFVNNVFYNNIGNYLTNMALINHSILYFASMLLMKNKKFYMFDQLKIIIFTAIYVIYALIIKSIVTYTQKHIFILMLLDGELLQMVTNNSNPSNFAYILYFIVLIIIYLLAINISLLINRLFNKLNT